MSLVRFAAAAAWVVATLLAGCGDDPAPTQSQPGETVTLGSLTHQGRMVADSGLIDVGLYGVPDLVDIDGDGDLDMFIGEWFGDIWQYENVGTKEDPSWHLVTKQFLGRSFDRSPAPCFVDLDGDNDRDLIIATRFTVGVGPGKFIYYENVGNSYQPSFQLVSDDFLDFDNDGVSKPAFVDIDADGDLDLFFGYLEEFPYGHQGLVFFRNNGTTKAAQFELVTTEYIWYPQPSGGSGQYLYPHFHDVDADGDLDLMIGHISSSDFYENIGSDASAAFRAEVAPASVSQATGKARVHQFVDLNGDAYLDLCIGIGIGWGSTPDDETGVVHFFEGGPAQ